MESINQKFVQLQKESFKIFGLDDLTSTIIGILYLEPKDILMDEIVKITGYSLSTISNKTKTLEKLGLIFKTRKPGIRKTFLHINKDLTNFLKKLWINKEKEVTRLAKENLPKIIKQYSLESNCDKRKIKIMENLYNQMSKYDLILDKFTAELEKISLKDNYNG
jgi:DNA-binding transcriptional regulator GbsR (MarR family)